MIKGCQRKIIVVNDTGSRYFDVAYFVIKSDLPRAASESDMLAEAHRMIDAYTAAPDNKNAPVLHQPVTVSRKPRSSACLILTGALIALISICLSIAGMMILT